MHEIFARGGEFRGDEVSRLARLDKERAARLCCAHQHARLSLLIPRRRVYDGHLALERGQEQVYC